MNKTIIEALYIQDLKKAQEKYDAMIRAAEYTKQDRLAALEHLQSKEPDQ